MTPLAEPFSTPQLVVLDVARLVVFTVGTSLAAYQVRLILLSQTPGQRARFTWSALAALILAGSRVENLGQPITWQFMAGLVAFAYLLFGTLQFDQEIPAQPRRDDIPPGRHGAT